MQKAKGDKERRKVVFILRIRQSEKVKLEKYSSPTRDIHNDYALTQKNKKYGKIVSRTKVPLVPFLSN